MNKFKLFISTLLTAILICFSSICLAKLNLNFLPHNHTSHASPEGKQAAPPEVHVKSRQALVSKEQALKKEVAPPEISKRTAPPEVPVKPVRHAPLLTAHILDFAKQKTVAKAEQPAHHGLASYYSDAFHGRRTASGEIYDKNKLTAVHMYYPFGTLLRVTNLQNNRSVTVKVNDRGRLAQNHLLDLSKQAALELGILSAGKAMVKVETL